MKFWPLASMKTRLEWDREKKSQPKISGSARKTELNFCKSTSSHVQNQCSHWKSKSREKSEDDYMITRSSINGIDFFHILTTWVINYKTNTVAQYIK